ncbi:MAG: HAD family hydrolase [Candidatus Thorarchaeota archaeon]
MVSIDFARFEAVVFDLDSTLTNTQDYPMIASEWLLRKSGHYSEEEMSTYVRTLVIRYRQAIQEIVDGAPYRNPSDIVRSAMEYSLSVLKLDVAPELIEEAFYRFKSLHIELSTVRDNVVEVLESLTAKGKKLGVISNSFEGHARIILTNLNLLHYFSTILDGESIQTYKPSRIPFEQAARNLNVDISKIVYIGDEYYADMVGAKRAGMTTIWINNRERSLSDLVEKHGVSSTPDYILESVSDMVDMI